MNTDNKKAIKKSTVQADISRLKRTIWAAVVAADAQSLSIALNILVIKLDPKRPAQVGLPHRVLQPPPGIGEPIGNLTKKWKGESEKKQRYCFDSLTYPRPRWDKDLIKTSAQTRQTKTIQLLKGIPDSFISYFRHLTRSICWPANKNPLIIDKCRRRWMSSIFILDSLGIVSTTHSSNASVLEKRRYSFTSCSDACTAHHSKRTVRNNKDVHNSSS